MSGGVRHCPDSAPPDPQLDPDDSGRVLTTAPQSKPEQLPVSISAGILPAPFAGCPERTRIAHPTTYDRRASTKKLTG